jgi:hypothetical protein
MIRTLLATTAASVAMVGIAHAQTSADVLETRSDIAAANHEHTRAADALEDAVSRSAANPIISRSRSASGVFSTKSRRFIMSVVIGGISGPGWCQQPDPTGTSPVTTSARTYTTLRDSI